MDRYEELPHTADIAIKVQGKDLGELFSNAAFGMFDIIADLDGLKTDISVDLNLKAASPEELLVSWLDELLYNFYTKSIIFKEFDIIDIAPSGLKARAIGRHIGAKKSRLKTEIKAVTYHNLNVIEKNGKFSVEIVFDV